MNGRVHWPRWLAFSAVTILGCVVWTALLSSSVAGQEPPTAAAPAVAAPPATAAAGEPRPPRAVTLIQVPLPIVGSVDSQVIRQIEQWVARHRAPTDPRPLLILEFSGPTGQIGSGSQFGRCLELAQYLSGERVRAVQVAAFLPQGCVGHAVLPVLACEQLIVGEEAVFGEAGGDEPFIDDIMRQSYASIAARHNTVPPAMALAMLDKNLAVCQVTTNDGTRFVLERDLPAVQKEVAVSKVENLSRVGDMARFTGRELRLRFPIASHVANDRQALATALDLPPAAVREDLAATGAWKGVRVELNGPIHGRQITFIERTLRQQVDGGCNFICIVIDSAGGAPDDAWRFAQFLASPELRGVRTVAYVPAQARASAGLIALACDHLWVAPDAVLGGEGDDESSLRVGAEIQRSIEQSELDLPRDRALMQAMVDPTTAVFHYTHQRTGEVRFFREADVAALDDPAVWTRGAPLPVAEGLRGNQLIELKLANGQAESLAEIKSYYHVEGELPEIKPNWAHMFIERLAHPAVAGLLLFIAIVALFVEFSQPGVGLPGFVSAVCFILYFWSHVLHGTAGWLEILLFIAGVVSVLVELFVLPGAVVFGLGGGVLILSSLILASQTFVIPRNAYQLGQLPQTLGTLSFVGLCAFGALVMLRRHLAEAPVLKEMVLAPPSDEDQEEQDERESLARLEFLLGQRGRTITPLLPSGKARFGDEIVNVTTEGQPLPDDAEVVVVAERGNYLVVQAVAGNPSTR